MESLPQTILFILTLVCGLSCGLLILGILALYLLGRLNIVRDLLSGLRGAARDDEIVDQAALPGTYGEVGRTRQQSSAAQRVAEARARADREFQSGVSPASPTREIDAMPDDEAPPLDRVGRLVQGALQTPLSGGKPGPGRRSRFVF